MKTETYHNFGKESSEKEFKTSFLFSPKDCKDDQKFVVFKAVCAMMNTNGGEVFIGVRDNGEIARGPYEGVMGDMRKLKINKADEYARYIRNRLDDYFYDAEYVRGIVQIAEVEYVEGSVIRISVCKADRVIYIHRCGNNERIACRREGAASNVMTRTMIDQRKKSLRKDKAIIMESLKDDEMHSIIQEAIDKKLKVALYSYCSSNSDSLVNRIVEPISFICDGRGIWAYEDRTDKKTPLRQFKLCRINNIELLNKQWEHEQLHRGVFVDAFEWSKPDKPSVHVTLILGPCAKNRLVEESPEAKKYLSSCGNDQWVFDADVHSLDPVKKFCLQFKDSITVYVPDELKKELGLIEKDENADSKIETVTEEKAGSEMEIVKEDDLDCKRETTFDALEEKDVVSRFKLAFSILMPRLTSRLGVSPIA